MKVVFTHHGSDYDRDKWGFAAKTMLKLGEYLGCKFADHVIVISNVIKNLIAQRCGRTKNVHLIYNGVPEPEICDYPEYFEELGMIRLEQPYEVEIDGKRFCLGHGDGLGPGMHGYKFMRKCFHSRFLQALFSSLHPWFAFRLGNGWSKKSRLGKSISYEFKGTSEPLYKYCLSYPNPVDYFIFGHYHCHADIPVSATGALATPTTVTTEKTSTEGGPRLLLLRDWIQCSNWIEFDGTSCHYTEEPSL